jgi:hypothetical protein
MILTVALAAALAAPASADTIWEVEAARANARAGGPTNAHDAELLERWGCLSGSRSAFCENLRYRSSATSGRYKRARR